MPLKIVRRIIKFIKIVVPKSLNNFYWEIMQLSSCMGKQHPEKLIPCLEINKIKVSSPIP